MFRKPRLYNDFNIKENYVNENNLRIRNMEINRLFNKYKGSNEKHKGHNNNRLINMKKSRRLINNN